MRLRFHFDIVQGQDVMLDHVGVEVDDLDQAIEAARSVIDEMRRDRELDAFASDCRLVIRDDRGVVVERIAIE